VQTIEINITTNTTVGSFFYLAFHHVIKYNQKMTSMNSINL